MNQDNLPAIQTTEIIYPGKIEATTISLLLKDLSIEEWLDLGIRLKKIHGCSQWWLGDWLNYGEHKFGQKYTQALDETDYGYDALSKYSWVCKNVEICIRIQNLSFSHHEQVAKLTQEKQIYWLTEAYNNDWSVSELRKRIKNQPDNDEYCTPANYIEAAREVMGDIDLDPATSEHAQEVIKANHYYIKEEDGLNRTWYGKVWLNPPFSVPLMEDFVTKLISEFEIGNVIEAIILTNSATDTKWCHKLLAEYPFCITEGRILFWYPDYDSLTPRQGQLLFYLGKNENKFKEVFSQFGLIAQTIQHK